MKAYGIPRIKDIEFPDILDIKIFGMQSHVGQLQTKSGDYRSYTRKAESRKATRRYWKRCERMEAKHSIKQQLE